jgi:starch synthase (maltosyl-transferring)
VTPEAAEGGRDASAPTRVVIEAVAPEIDGGRFAVKRTAGETVEISADVFADGHDHLAAVLLHRRAAPAGGAPAPWQEVPMRHEGNDRWLASFQVGDPGDYEYTVQGWIDRFATWQDALSKKYFAAQDVGVDLVEGAEMVREAARRRDGDDAAWLLEQAGTIGAGDDVAARVGAGLSATLATVMRRQFDRAGAATYPRTLRVIVDRERARFGAWYEMFPRSAGPDPTRSATFAEAARRLPDIAAMGFDVLYLPPIHPIGRSFRKGRNNALEARPGDPGSPWAIGSAEGGHTAVEPGLGTLDDFDRFRETAERLGLEVALDLAYQCSPDHPYVREHPSWFSHRPDGTIKYAENPPKKYQDIYPLDFSTADWRALWEELKNVVLFWVGHGVKIFRVDNPHTKPFRFWEWMLGEVRRAHPDVIFLSEAFTRPKVMRHLAKLGFTQSYTYFTWRNSRAELTEYFTELTGTPVREYMRPNLFANTPDILHEYLQQGGPPAFQVRLVLAATLGASYGIYSGFEVCENRPVRAGSEEYLDSEKYQYRKWDWGRPGNITELVARVNQIRRENPALHADWSLRFHETDNDRIICYSKTSEDRSNALLVVVNLDPAHLQHGWVRAPLADWGLDPARPYEMDDLLAGERFRWQGEWNYVRLEPGTRPAHVLRVPAPPRPPAASAI